LEYDGICTKQAVHFIGWDSCVVKMG
jgi:hypothetical protein